MVKKFMEIDKKITLILFLNMTSLFNKHTNVRIIAVSHSNSTVMLRSVMATCFGWRVNIHNQAGKVKLK